MLIIKTIGLLDSSGLCYLISYFSICLGGTLITSYRMSGVSGGLSVFVSRESIGARVRRIEIKMRIISGEDFLC